MRLCRSLCLLALATASAVAQPKKEELTGNAAKAAEFATAEVARYDIRHADNAKAVLKLHPEPALRWSNAIAGDVHGAVYLWMRNGCPEAAVSAYQFFNRKQLNVELVSLSDVPLSAKRNDKARWAPEAGVEFKPLPDAPAPADTAEKRLLQMRALARKFVGQLSERGEPDDKFTDLRLMAAPLHKYEATDESGREGGVFAFVTTTDPEILLLLESRKGKTGREWFWTAARMHYRPLRLSLGDKTVWEAPAVAPPWNKIRGPEGRYIILEWNSPEAAAKD
jgi:hypothetical protein